MVKKLSCALSLLTVTGILFSCGTGAPTATVTEATDTVTADTAAPDSGSVLQNLDFGGQTINILLRGVDGIIRNEIYVTDNNGDVLNDAIYKRNSKVEEQLNVKLSFSESGTASAADFPTDVTNSILAGDDTYGIIAWGQSKVLKMAKSGIFTNLKQAEYLNVENPWWNYNYIRNLMTDSDTMYFVTGDLSLTYIARMSSMFFNKNIFTQNGWDADKLYDTVRNGEWTQDMLAKYVVDSYQDLNGNGTPDEGDRFGMITTNTAIADHFAYSEGLRTVEITSSGKPEIIIEMNNASKIFDNLKALYYDNIGTFVTTDAEINNGGNAARFANGKTLFMPYWFEAADLLRDMADDFGIIPYPKLDETQESYRSLVQNSNSVFCIPVTCENPDVSCAVLEALCYENHTSVLSAYYEYTLKNKYSRDNDTGEMIDLIRESTITDFGYAYASSLGNIGTISRLVLKDDNANFTSTYASIEQMVTENLKKFIEE